MVNHRNNNGDTPRASGNSGRQKPKNRAVELGDFLLANNPFLEMLALNGSTANGRRRSKNIEFFAVSKEKRAWECLSACRYYARRYSKKAGTDGRSICFGYVVDRRTALAEMGVDRFLAQELLDLQVLSGHSTYLRMLIGQTHIARFFPRSYLQRVFAVSADGGASMEAARPWPRSRTWPFILARPIVRALAAARRRRARRKHGGGQSGVKVIGSPCRQEHLEDPIY
jgi:hypothetical protein